MILLYHGTENLKNEPLWKIFGENISDELKRFIPDFDIILSDFTTYDDEKIKNLFDSFHIRTAVFLMRDIFHEELFRSTFEMILQEFTKLHDKEDILDFFNLILYYIYSYSDKRYYEAEEIIGELKSKGDKKMETILDRYIKIGRKEGMLRQAVIIVLGLYKTKSFPIDEIAQLTQLSITQVKIILSLYKTHKENTLDYLEKNRFEDIR